MRKVSLFCVILVFALLLEDGSSVRKKTEDERKEDEEIAEKVNATLAEEEEKRRKEEEDEKKKRQLNPEKKKTETEQGKGSGTGDTEKEKGQDEACPTLNQTCPKQEPCQTCPEVKECPVCEMCPEFKPEVCPEQKDCPEVDACPPFKCDLCKTCGFETVENPVVVLNNSTDVHQECPAPPSCSESAGMSAPLAMFVGACASLLITGLAAVIGLLLRYVPPIASGFLFLATIIILWYLCSQYPETARELGGRAATLLREAAVALGHRLMAAVQRHQEQVSVPIKLDLFF
jgi:hypothetical protein